MLYLDRIEPLLSMSGVAIRSAFDVVLLKHLVASILNGDFAIIPRIQFGFLDFRNGNKVFQAILDILSSWIIKDQLLRRVIIASHHIRKILWPNTNIKPIVKINISSFSNIGFDNLLIFHDKSRTLFWNNCNCFCFGVVTEVWYEIWCDHISAHSQTENKPIPYLSVCWLEFKVKKVEVMVLTYKLDITWFTWVMENNGQFILISIKKRFDCSPENNLWQIEFYDSSD